MPSPETMRCLDCGYDLRGLPENRCPECGRPFDPTDPRSYGPGNLSGSAYFDAAVFGVWIIVAATGPLLLAALAHADFPAWLVIIASLALLGGLSLEIVVLCSAGWRLITRRYALRIDRMAHWKAFGLSAAALVALLLVCGLLLLHPW